MQEVAGARRGPVDAAARASRHVSSLENPGIGGGVWVAVFLRSGTFLRTARISTGGGVGGGSAFGVSAPGVPPLYLLLLSARRSPGRHGTARLNVGGGHPAGKSGLGGLGGWLWRALESRETLYSSAVRFKKRNSWPVYESSRKRLRCVGAAGETLDRDPGRESRSDESPLRSPPPPTPPAHECR